ncbi:BolA family transcriptional regulator, partial [Staphylococcus aureus]|nr:BolA family transcriptional regulator [Staphylococcus aureus]
VSINVVSSAFEGQSAVNRQRMVYKAIGEELQSTVHAVDQMTTRTPSEAAKNE